MKQTVAGLADSERVRVGESTRIKVGWSCWVTRLVLIIGALFVWPGSASADKIAIFRIDSLGVPASIVARLEGLLRMEVDRLVGEASPDSAKLKRLLARQPSLRDCTGERACMSAIGRLLGVDQVISGNVGGLGDSYVVNLKLVDARRVQEVRRVQETISGDPDQLIEAVRVAAYGLIAPERLRGALSVLVSVAGADVYLDGKWLGKTPLDVQHGLEVGDHNLRVSKPGYVDVLQAVQVRFQKTAEVVVRLELPQAGAAPQPGGAVSHADRPVPWYTRWWFWTAVGVVAAGTGALLGYSLGANKGVNCSAEPSRCGL